jgi:hypothetical protein
MATHNADARIKVLSIVGTGRSGTTVLAAILGETAGIFNAGELHWVWGRSLSEQRPCGCGRPPAECPIWSRVVEGALGVPPSEQAAGRGGTATAEIVRDERELLARRNRVRLLRGARADASWPALERIRAVTENLYANLVDVTGARVIVDASKRPEDAAVLSGIDSVDHYVLHIVRDPRAVVFSWSRAKASPDGTTVMRRMRPPRIILAWMENNAGAELLQRHVPPERWFFTRYEDFVARPRDVVSDILAFLEETGDAPFTDQDTVALGVNHTLLGNPDRFRIGAVRIKPDEQWRSLLSWRLRVLVAAATLPLMLRYGYVRSTRRDS